MKIISDVSKWAYQDPFRIAYHTFEASELLTIEIDCDGVIGRGEASSHPHLQSLKEGLAIIESLNGRADLTPQSLQAIMPAGPARNALDCALWDLQCKQQGKRIWEVLGIETVRPVETAYTIGIADEAAMVAKAKALSAFSLLKLKVDGNHGFDLLAAIADARPDARFIIDANEGWQPAMLRDFVERAQSFPVSLIEQPLSRHDDAVLAEFDCPIPLAADESFHRAEDVFRLKDRYQVINIKLDKIGGLTEALTAVRLAQEEGVDIMIGCNGGTSLGIAPAFCIGQFAAWADLDSPLMLTRDRSSPLEYVSGTVLPPSRELWG